MGMRLMHDNVYMILLEGEISGDFFCSSDGSRNDPFRFFSPPFRCESALANGDGDASYIDVNGNMVFRGRFMHRVRGDGIDNKFM